jgi:hypothetical protein
MRNVIITVILGFFSTSTVECKENKQSRPEEVTQTPVVIPKGKVQVATYYFPNWGPVNSSEWATLKAAKPRFKGHQQPKVPMWGYTNENDPQAMAQKINAAADNGITAFIFDWYYYNPGSNILNDQNNGHCDGQKYLSKALENGFLKAANNNKMKFALLWCNHDLGGGIKGAVAPATFEGIMDYVIEKYFKNPSYWKINGCPYFSIYQINTFLETYGNDYAKAAAAIELFRSKVKSAGFPDLHLNGVLWGLSGDMNNKIKLLKLSSTTSYVWIHHNSLPDFPSNDYSKVADTYFKSMEYGGGLNGLEATAKLIPVPYHINVSMGWDSSPRCKDSAGWMTRRDYPYGPVIANNTPYLFKKYLAKAKELTMEKPENERIITINSWNEWGEGSYLEPDMINGMKYLEAIKDVFGSGK